MTLDPELSASPPRKRTRWSLIRWVVLAVLVIVISAAATVAVQFLPASPSSLVSPTGEGGPAPLAIVEGELTHRFGAMAQHTQGTWVWKIRNEGEGDLTLKKGTATCSCTIANLPEGESAVLKPGGNPIPITLSWNTKDAQGKYQQSATILTNDPEHPQIRLAVEGVVQPAILVLPTSAIDFLHASNETSHRAQIALVSIDKPDMKILSATSSAPELISATIEPLSTDDVKRMRFDGGVKPDRGYQVTVELKPATILGAFREEVLVRTDHPLQAEIHLIVVGTLTGPITVVPETIPLSDVPAARGGTATATIWVRGQDSTRFEVENVPKKLKVSVAPVDEKARGPQAPGRGKQYRLTVNVPPGTEPGSIVGEILLKTDHPRAGQVKVRVNVLVVGEG